MRPISQSKVSMKSLELVSESNVLCESIVLRFGEQPATSQQFAVLRRLAVFRGKTLTQWSVAIVNCDKELRVQDVKCRHNGPDVTVRHSATLNSLEVSKKGRVIDRAVNWSNCC